MNLKLTTNLFGLIGIVIAFIGIGVAVYHDNYVKQPEETVVQALMDMGKEQLGIKEKETPPTKTMHLVLGFVALFFAVVSFLYKESHRFSGVAAGLGVVVIAWEYVLIGVTIAVIIFILSYIDFSP